MAVFREDTLMQLAEAVRELEKEGIHKKAIVHVKVDTGMSRIGITPDERGLSFVQKLLAVREIEAEGILTHFARADEYDRSPAMVQLERYLDFSRRVEEAGVEIPLHHCSNSAGIIRMPEANLNIVRAGITIYGIYPSSEVERDIVKLEPVMELKSHVTYVTVSYTHLTLPTP